MTWQVHGTKHRQIIQVHIHHKAADSLKDHIAVYQSTLMRRTHMSLTNDESIPIILNRQGKYTQIQMIQR